MRSQNMRRTKGRIPSVKNSGFPQPTVWLLYTLRIQTHCFPIHFEVESEAVIDWAKSCVSSFLVAAKSQVCFRSISHLKPLLEPEKKSSLLHASFKSVFCLAPMEILEIQSCVDEKTSDIKVNPLSIISKPSLFPRLSFYFWMIVTTEVMTLFW